MKQKWTGDDVLRVTRHAQPDESGRTGRTQFVLIDGQKWPVKQVLRLLGFHKFQSHFARGFLYALGFEVVPPQE